MATIHLALIIFLLILSCEQSLPCIPVLLSHRTVLAESKKKLLHVYIRMKNVESSVVKSLLLNVAKADSIYALQSARGFCCRDNLEIKEKLIITSTISGRRCIRTGRE